MIYWNTDVNAPCCPGEIVAEDGRTVLVQTDYDYPGVASTFGWSTTDVQRDPAASAPRFPGDTFGGGVYDKATGEGWCRHDGTDGTVDCPDCGIKAGEFIASAGQFLYDNDGAEAEDPGYFS